jgi:hypothetical protein
MESLANSLLTTDLENFANSEHGISNDSIFDAILEKDRPPGRGGRSSRRRADHAEQPVAQVADRDCVPCGYGECMTERTRKADLLARFANLRREEGG